MPCPPGRIDSGDKAKAELLSDDRARDLERGNRHARGDAEHSADQYFLDQHHQNRPERGYSMW
jgi:hypothetical protein